MRDMPSGCTLALTATFPCACSTRFVAGAFQRLHAFQTLKEMHRDANCLFRPQ